MRFLKYISIVGISFTLGFNLGNRYRIIKILKNMGYVK